MKRFVSPLLLVFILTTMSLGWRTSTARDEPLSSALRNPINMTLDGNRLYVSDMHTGLHVFDVSALAAPRRLMQIPLEYNRGSAVKDDVVYTNDGAQLVALRISDDSYTVVARIGVKFHDVPSPGFDEGSSFSCACATSYDAMVAPTAPTGSSYATFAVVDDQLYRVDGGDLVVYDVTTADSPTKVSQVPMDWTVETIHPAANLLFMGSTRGMYIFDRVDPEHPKQISKLEHARACDPVVVSGSTAYVTLRGSDSCGAAPDELLCVNIKNPQQPVLLGQKPLASPWGLAVHDTQLYVSHGDNGYSLVDVANPQNPSIQKTWTGESTRDFIWSGNTLFVLNDHNVSIYNITNPMAPVLLSRLPNGATL
jgi:hypothetical protein